MKNALVFRKLEKLTEQRKDGEDFACCLMKKEYQDLFTGVVRVLRYKKNGSKYDPIHLYEGNVKGHDTIDKATVQEINYHQYGRYFAYNTDTVLAYWGGYQIIDGLGLWLTKDGSDWMMKANGWYNDKSYLKTGPIKFNKITDMTNNRN